MIHRHLHLQPHRHSGSALHHRHTSYRALVAVVILAGLFVAWLIYYSNNKAVVIQPQPTYESIASDNMPFISSPAVNSQIYSSRVELEGTCSKKTQNYVIIRNSAKITGSAKCTSDGQFSTYQPALYGSNVFTASSTNISNRETSVSVDTAVNGATGSIKDPVRFSSDIGVIFYTPKKEFRQMISLEGGLPPYTINVNWGDDNRQKIETKDPVVELKHAYQGNSDRTVVIVVEGFETESQTYNFVATSVNSQKTNKTTVVASAGVGSGGGSTPQFAQAFVFGFYALLLVVLVPLAHHPRYAPEIIEFDLDGNEQ